MQQYDLSLEPLNAEALLVREADGAMRPASRKEILAVARELVNADGVLELWNRRFLELSGLAPIAAHRDFAEVIADSDRFVEHLRQSAVAVWASTPSFVRQQMLDVAYVERWCRQHGTLARLEDIRRSIPEI